MDELKKKENRQVLDSWFTDVDLALEYLVPPSEKKQKLQERFLEFREEVLSLLD